MGHLLLLFLMLMLALLLASTQAASSAEISADNRLGGMVGSRPPSCAGRCRSCGRCEAVQVPISPQELRRRKKQQQQQLGRHGSPTDGGGGGRAAMPSSYDDHSNYKPLSWRCKCGRLILNP